MVKIMFVQCDWIKEILPEFYFDVAFCVVYFLFYAFAMIRRGFNIQLADLFLEIPY